jgi:hypothetical protein
MQLDVRVNLKEAEKYLTGLRKDQIPFATAYALTQTAKDAQKNIVDEMQRVFDRPKPYTLNGTYVKAATKRDLTAVVKLKDGYLGATGDQSKRGTADKYLRAEVQGGPRRNTAFEKALIYNGLMPPGYFAIPTNFAPKDPFGNVPSGFYVRIMSQLQIGDEFQRANKERKTRRKVSRPKNSSPIARQEEFQRKELRRKQARLRAVTRPKKRASYPIFNVYPGREKNKHLKPGVYERVNSGFLSTVRPMFIYVNKAPNYKPRLNFNRIVSDTAAARLTANFEKGFAFANATKRPLG